MIALSHNTNNSFRTVSDSGLRWVVCTLLSLTDTGEEQMNTIGYRNKIGGAILAISLVFGIGMIASTTVQAQDRNDGRWRRDDRNRDERDRDWRRHRNDDRYRGRRDDRYDRDDRYRSDRYDRNDRYGRNGGYGNYGGYNNRAQIELNQGYQAGLNTGSSDARRGQSYNPQRSHYYKDARTQQVRSGFLRGYSEGYRQYGGYNNDDRYRRNNGGFGNILGDIFGRP